jgi:hypothetical protein
MSQSLFAAIHLELEKTLSEGQATPRDYLRVHSTTAYTDGTGASSANKEWNDYRTLGGSADSLDLAGTLANRIGETASFAKIKLVYLKTPAANTGNVTFGGGSNAWAALWGSTLVLKPGSEVLLKTTDADGWAVTAGTGDILQVAGTSGDVYEIAIAGE